MSVFKSGLSAGFFFRQLSMKSLKLPVNIPAGTLHSLYNPIIQKLPRALGHWNPVEEICITSYLCTYYLHNQTWKESGRIPEITY